MLATVSSFIFGRNQSSHQIPSSSPQESSSSSSSTNPKQQHNDHSDQFPSASSLLPRFKSPRNFYFSSSLLSTVLLSKNSRQLASSMKFLRIHLCHHTDFLRKNCKNNSSDGASYYCCGVDDDFIPTTKNQRETFIFEQLIPILIQKSHLVKTLESSREFGDFCQCVFDDCLNHGNNEQISRNNHNHKNCKSVALAALRDTLIEILKRKTTNNFEDIHVQSIIDALNQYFIVSLSIIGEEENAVLNNATSEFNHTQDLIRVLAKHNHLRDLLCDCINTIESPTLRRNHGNNINNSSNQYLYERQDSESLLTQNNSSNDSQHQPQLFLPHRQLHRSTFFSYSSISRLLSSIIQVQILLNNNNNEHNKRRNRFSNTSFKSFFGTDYIRDNILVPALQDHQVPDLSETPKLIRKILQTLEYSVLASSNENNNNNKDDEDRGIHEKKKFYALYCSPTSPVQKSLLHIMGYVPCVPSHPVNNNSFTEKERRNSKENVSSQKDVQSKEEIQNKLTSHHHAHAHHHHHHLLSFLQQNIIPICELIETMVLFSKFLANSVKTRDGSKNNNSHDADDVDDDDDVDFLSGGNNNNNNESLTQTKTLIFNRSPNLVVVVTPHLEHKFSQMATFFLESKMLCVEHEIVVKRVLQLIQQERKADRFLKSLVVVHNNNNQHQDDLQRTASANLLGHHRNPSSNKIEIKNSTKNNKGATSFLVDYKNHKSGSGKLDDNVDEWLTYGKFDDYEDDDSALQVENSSFSDVVVSSPLTHELESKQKMLSEARRKKEKIKKDKKWFANLAERHSCRGGGSIPDDVIEILLEHRIDEHSFLHLDADTLTRTLKIPLGPKLLILDLIKKEKNLIEKASSKNSVESGQNGEKKETAISPMDRNNHFILSPSAHHEGEEVNDDNNNNDGFSLLEARRSSSVTFDPAMVMHELNSRHQSSNLGILEYFRRHSTTTATAGMIQNNNFSNTNNNNNNTAVIINDPYEDHDLTPQARELLTKLHFEVFPSSNLVFSPKQIQHDPESQLGKGSNGTVSVAHIIPLGRRSCAAKFIPNVKNGIEEAKHYVRMDHPNITKLYGVTVTNTETPSIVLLLELGKHNFSLILDAVGASSMLTTDKIRRYAGQLASALSYLHRRKTKIAIEDDHDDGSELTKKNNSTSSYSRLLNLDLKPENILVFPGDVLKLVDFGSLQNVSQTMSERTGVGTTEIYSPPEYFSNRIRNEKFEISPAYDVYAFGLILLRMMVSDYLFDSEIRPQLFEMQRKIYASEGSTTSSKCPFVIEYFPSRFNEVKDEDLKEICKKCLFVDSRLRPKDGDELLELLQWEDEEEKEQKLLARFSGNHRRGEDDVSCPFNANNGNDTSYVQTLQ